MLRPRRGFPCGIVWDTGGGISELSVLAAASPGGKEARGTADWGAHRVAAARRGVGSMGERAPSPPRTSATVHLPAGMLLPRPGEGGLPVTLLVLAALLLFAKCGKEPFRYT